MHKGKAHSWRWESDKLSYQRRDFWAGFAHSYRRLDVGADATEARAANAGREDPETESEKLLSYAYSELLILSREFESASIEGEGL